MIIWKYFQFILGNLTFKTLFIYRCVLCTFEHASAIAHSSGNRVSDYLALELQVCEPTSIGAGNQIQIICEEQQVLLTTEAAPLSNLILETIWKTICLTRN